MNLLRHFAVGTKNVRVRSQQSGGSVAESLSVELVRDHEHIGIWKSPLHLQRWVQSDDSSSNHGHPLTTLQCRRHSSWCLYWTSIKISKYEFILCLTNTQHCSINTSHCTRVHCILSRSNYIIICPSNNN